MTVTELPQCSDRVRAYFERLRSEIDRSVEVARRARAKGLDPMTEVEPEFVGDIASRVEHMVGPPGVAETIRNLEGLGLERDDIAFRVVDEIVEGMHGEWDPITTVDQALKTGLAIMTEAAVAAAFEGIEAVRLFRNEDGSSFIQVVYAGPIRSAGGTAQALTLAMADHARRRMGIGAYHARDVEVERYKEEQRMYGARQYESTEAEVERVVRGCPIMISSGPGGSAEPKKMLRVAAYSDIDRIDDLARNFVREPAMLVIHEGVLLKAKKLLAFAQKYGLPGWGWLAGVAKGEEERKKILDVIEGEAEEAVETIERPDIPVKELHSDKYLGRVPAGRPILCHHGRKGGFSLRYGRTRTTGLNSVAVHPSTTYALNHFPTIAIQLALSAPGKGATVQTCDTIEPPVVKLKSGDVVRLDDWAEARRLNEERQIKEVISCGEVLVSFGDFSEANRRLLPGAWCREWYNALLEKAIKEGKKTSVSYDRIGEIIQTKPTVDEAFTLSRELGVPLHSAYTHTWHWAAVDDIKRLREEVKGAKGPRLPATPEIERVLEDLLVLYKAPKSAGEGGGELEIDDTDWGVLRGLLSTDGESDAKGGLRYVREVSGIKVMAKAPTTIGARIGRPPNDPRKSRAMRPAVQVLFPLGLAGGPQRRVDKAVEKGEIEVEVAMFRCPKCGDEGVSLWCRKCGQRGEIAEAQPGKLLTKIPIKEIYEDACERCGVDPEKTMVKGVRGVWSDERIAEPLEKGILRAKYGLPVFKDGTVRGDRTGAVITAFRPEEIRTSVERLRELGYEADVEGKPLEDPKQLVEIFPQDVILPYEMRDERYGALLLKMAKYVDELLEKFYGMEPFYKAEKAEDLVGQLLLSLAPHTSCAVPVRLIGFAKGRCVYGHPLAIAARRRDCLPAFEVVTFRTSDGEWHVGTVSELYDQWIRGKRVDMPACAREGGARTMSKVVGVYPREPGSLFRLTVKTLGDVFVTQGHKIPVIDGGRTVIKHARNIRIGDVLSSAQPSPLLPSVPVESVNLIDKYSHLPDAKNIRIVLADQREKVVSFIRSIGGYGRAAKLCGAVYRKKWQPRGKRVWEYVNKNGTLPLGCYISLRKRGLALDESRLYVRFRRSKARVPVMLDALKLMYLAGLTIADGYLRRTQVHKGNCGYQVFISTYTKDERDRLATLSRELFGTSTYGKKYGTTICSHVAYDVMSGLIGTGRSALEKEIPSCVITADTEAVKHFLAGYIDGDGSVDKHGANVVISSGNRRLVAGLKVLCEKVGLHPSARVTYGRIPGPAVRERYTSKGRPVPAFDEYRIVLKKSDSQYLLPYLGGEKRQRLEDALHSAPAAQPAPRTARAVVTKIARVANSEPVYDIELNPHHLFPVGTGYVLVHNSDGDADDYMLMTGTLIDFSKRYLPKRVGAKMDMPVMIIPFVNPLEVDKQARGVDVAERYPLELYEAAQRYEPAREWRDKVPCAGEKFGKPDQYEGYHYTHEVDSINYGGLVCEYIRTKEVGEKKPMAEKVADQIRVMENIRAVDLDDAVARLIRTHLVPDVRGNLRKYSTQRVRCSRCNKKFRRMPLSGKCPKCDRPLILTVHEGGVRKYIRLMSDLASKIKDATLRQEAELLVVEVDAFFRRPPGAAPSAPPAQEQVTLERYEEEEVPEEGEGGDEE